MKPPAAAIDLAKRFEIHRVQNGVSSRVADAVALEEPLAIRLAHHFKDVVQVEELAVTMRTPGADRELVAGYLLSEGIISSGADLTEIRELGPAGSNELLAELQPSCDVEAWRLRRSGLAGASCGLCGKRSREAIYASVPARPTGGDSMRVDAAFLQSLTDALNQCQQGFSQTGGLHAAAAFTLDGRIEAIYEDIGRHNALDKLIGHFVLGGRLPLSDRVVLMSSRSSFELVQKAAMAGVPMLVTIGGPSSLAIEAARDFGITLLGFLSRDRFNVYSGESRINL